MSSLGNMSRLYNRMKNLKKFLFILVILFGLFINTVNAEDTIPPVETKTIHLKITTNTGALYDKDILVSECNSDNAGTLKITAYCAVLQSEVESDWNWTWGPAFLNSLGGISGFTSKDKDNNDVYHYWSWYVNNTEGSISMSDYLLNTGDSILINFIDPVEPTPEVVVEEKHTHSSSGSYASNKILKIEETKKIFDTKKAFEFLISQQKENGSFGEDLYTDWATLAFASNTENTNQKNKLIKYLTENKFSGTSLTDLERHSMALMSVGLNPYNTNNENYIQKIISNFDGTQFGEKDKDNDDIFALIVLQNAGFTEKDIILEKTINFILSKQKENGSWDNNVDITSASMQSLYLFNKNDKVKASLEKGKEFLKQNQKEDGGFGNISSTAWAIQGILSLGEKPIDWRKNDKNPIEYIANNQDIDGGIKNLSVQAGEYLNNKLWETSYVLSSLSLKTWVETMHKFEKQNIKINTVINKKIETKINNSNKIKFQNKIEKFQKTDIENSEIEKPTKTNWFKKFINKVFRLKKSEQ